MKTSEVSYMFVLMKNNLSGEKLETQNSCFIIFSCFFFDDNFRKGIRLGENSSNPKCPNVQHCAKQIKNFKNSLITKTWLNRKKVDKFLKFYCFSLVNEIRCTKDSNGPPGLRQGELSFLVLCKVFQGQWLQHCGGGHASRPGSLWFEPRQAFFSFYPFSNVSS